MTTHVDSDPDFDDEDEVFEGTYRQLLRKRAPLPPCDPKSLPVTSLARLSLCCTRIEAENILKSAPHRCSGNFIVRPTIYVHHPYSLSVLASRDSVFHFQIAHVLNQFCIGPWDQVDQSKAKMFPTLRSFIEYYLTNPLTFEDDKSSSWQIPLRFYVEIEATQF